MEQRGRPPGLDPSIAALMRAGWHKIGSNVECPDAQQLTARGRSPVRSGRGGRLHALFDNLRTRLPL